MVFQPLIPRLQVTLGAEMILWSCDLNHLFEAKVDEVFVTVLGSQACSICNKIIFDT